MNTAFAQAFDAIAITFGNSTQATIKRGRDTIAVMMGTGVQGMRGQDETGRIIGRMASVRYKASSEPDKPIAEGDLIELTYQGKKQDMRVEGRMDIAGLVRLTLIAEFE